MGQHPVGGKVGMQSRGRYLTCLQAGGYSARCVVSNNASQL